VEPFKPKFARESETTGNGDKLEIKPDLFKENVIVACNFSEDTLEEELETHFGLFGEITGCKFVLLDKLRVAVISFKTAAMAETAVASAYTHPFKGNQNLCVEPLAQSYFLEEFQRQMRKEAPKPSVQKQLHDMALKIKHLPPSVSEEEMRRELTKYGDLVLFQMQNMRHKPSKYCIFTYREAQDMQRLLQLQQLEAFGIKIQVKPVQIQTQLVSSMPLRKVTKVVNKPIEKPVAKH